MSESKKVQCLRCGTVRPYVDNLDDCCYKCGSYSNRSYSEKYLGVNNGKFN
jgi:hypothetical protein